MQECHLPAAFNGHTTNEWIGRWVSATVRPEGDLARKRVTGMVTRASVKRYPDGDSVLLLTIADPEGFIHGAIDARDAREVAPPHGRIA